MDFESVIAAFRIKWLKDCSSHPLSIWYHNKIFNKVGGLDFLLKCEKLGFPITFHHTIPYYGTTGLLQSIENQFSKPIGLTNVYYLFIIYWTHLDTSYPLKLFTESITLPDVKKN